MSKRLKRRIVLRITTQRKLEGLALRHGLKPTVAINQIIDWLVQQPDLIQAAVLGRFKGAIDTELAEVIVRSMKRK